MQPLDLMRMAVPPVTRIIQHQGHRISHELEKMGIVSMVELGSDDDESS